MAEGTAEGTVLGMTSDALMTGTGLYIQYGWKEANEKVQSLDGVVDRRLWDWIQVGISNL